MKKVISLILCAIMLFGCLPMMSFAEDEPIMELTTFTGSDMIGSGKTAVVKAGTSFEVPPSTTLYVPEGATLKVEAGAELNIRGSIIVMDNAVLSVEGEIKNGGNVTLNSDRANAYVLISYPSLEDCGAASDWIDSIKCWYGDTATADMEEKGLHEIAELKTNDNKLDLESGGSFAFPLNKFLFVDVDIFEPVPDRPRFDESKYMIFFKGTGLGYKQGYSSCKVSNSGELSFTKWVNESDFYKMCKIQLPTGEGYEVIGRDCEISADGTVYIKYGDPFAFRVEIDEAYDMSDYRVYIYNGYGFLGIVPENSSLIPDDFFVKDEDDGLKDGWYTFRVLDPAKTEAAGTPVYENKVIGDSTVYVLGVTKNETINMIGNIIETIKSVFNMLKEFFEGIIEAFKGGI